MQKCLVTIALGDFEWKRNALAVMDDYCSRLSIYHEVLTSVPEQYSGIHPSWFGLIAHEFFPNYDFWFRLGLDNLPTREAPNILNYVDPDIINSCPEQEEPNPKEHVYPYHIWNGDTMGYSYKQADFMGSVFHKYHHDPKSYPSHEQYYINWQIGESGCRVNGMSKEFNTFWHPGVSNYGDTWFHHYTCKVPMEEKPKWIKAHHDRYFA